MSVTWQNTEQVLVLAGVVSVQIFEVRLTVIRNFRCLYLNTFCYDIFASFEYGKRVGLYIIMALDYLQ